MNNQDVIHQNNVVKNDLLRVFIGCDARQPVTYNVMQFSVTRQSSKPVQVSPLYINQLPITRQGLTPFTYTRFLVPWLCDYQGWALFTDADQLVQGDLAELFSYADDQYDVMVVKTPERFEWASVMLFNCAKCRPLTPEYVQNTESNNLFRFNWGADVKVGELPREWNHLVGYSPKREGAKLIHYTQGSPMFPEIGNCEYSSEWLQEHLKMNSYRTWQEVMGPSVHAGWLSGELVPKLVVSDQLEEARRQLEGTLTIENPHPEKPLSRDNLSARYQQRTYQFMHRHLTGDSQRGIAPADTDSGMNIANLIGHIHQFIAGKGITSLLDYGAGKTMQYAPIKANTAQGEQTILLKQHLKLSSITCYDPAYPPISTLPKEQSDIVVCVDVLDRCPEEDLSWIVLEVFRFARKLVLIKVNDWDNGVKLDGGESEVCTIKPKEWWIDLISSAKSEYPALEISLIIQNNAQGQAEDISALVN